MSERKIITEEMIFEKYGKNHHIKKLNATTVYLATLGDNQSVVWGDGETYCWLLTEKDSDNCFTPINKGRN